MGEQRASAPRFRREGDIPRVALTPDDIEILRRVWMYRFVRADDLYRLFPDRSPDRLSRRLTLLYRSRHIDRPIAQVDRYGAGGSKALVYGLDNAGARIVAELLGYPVASGEWKARNRRFTRENLDHTLAVARFLVSAELGCRTRDDLSFIPFDALLADAPPATQRMPQPQRWPVSVHFGPWSTEVLLAPDAIFGLRRTGQDGRTTRAFGFVEIDRGSMTIEPSRDVRESAAFLHRTSVLRKLLTYAASHQLALQRTHFGIPAARVLFVTSSAVRAEAMREVAHRLVVRPLRLPGELFLFAGPDACDRPFEVEWRDAAGAPHRLAP